MSENEVKDAVEILKYIRKEASLLCPESEYDVNELKQLDTILEIDIDPYRKYRKDLTKYSLKLVNNTNKAPLKKSIIGVGLPNSYIMDYLLIKIVIDHEIVDSIKTYDDTIEIQFSILYDEKIKRVFKCKNIIVKIDFSNSPDKNKKDVYLKYIICLLSPHIYDNKEINENVKLYLEKFAGKINNETKKRLLGILAILNDEELTKMKEKRFIERKLNS